MTKKIFLGRAVLVGGLCGLLACGADADGDPGASDDGVPQLRDIEGRWGMSCTFFEGAEPNPSVCGDAAPRDPGTIEVEVNSDGTFEYSLWEDGEPYVYSEEEAGLDDIEPFTYEDGLLCHSMSANCSTVELIGDILAICLLSTCRGYARVDD